MPGANQFQPVPSLAGFKFKSDLATAPPAAAAPRQKKGVKKTKAKAKAGVSKKRLSMKTAKGAKAGKPLVEMGEGAIMNEKLVYNRAYKRSREAELRKGSTLKTAKKVASETAKKAVKFFLDGGTGMT